MDASLTQLDQRLDPLQDGVKTMLLCKLEQMQREMVDAGGIADKRPQTRASVYATYHALGGNGTAPSQSGHTGRADSPEKTTGLAPADPELRPVCWTLLIRIQP